MITCVRAFVQSHHSIEAELTEIIYTATVHIVNIVNIPFTENNKPISNKRSVTFDVQQK